MVGLRVFLVILIFYIAGSLYFLVPVTMYREDYYDHRTIKHLPLTSIVWLAIMFSASLFSFIFIFIICVFSKAKYKDKPTLDLIIENQRFLTTDKPSTKSTSAKCDIFVRRRSDLQQLTEILSFHVFLMFKPKEYWKCCCKVYHNYRNRNAQKEQDERAKYENCSVRFQGGKISMNEEQGEIQTKKDDKSEDQKGEIQLKKTTKVETR